ncbi:hypothetical protein ACMYYO_14725 [Dermacoccaceae bacterium W4C1]
MAGQRDFYREQFTLDAVDRAADWDPRDPRLAKLDLDSVDAVAKRLGMDTDRYARLKELAEHSREQRGHPSPEEIRERLAAKAAEASARREQARKEEQQRPQRRSSRDECPRDDLRRGGPTLR